MEKNKSINKYIDDIISNIKDNGGTVSKNAVLKFKSKYLNSSKSLEKIYEDIDNNFESFFRDYNDRLKYHDELKKYKTRYNSSFAPFLGETYKSTLFDLFTIFEDINNKEFDSMQKEVLFNTKFSKYMFDKKNELTKYFKKYTNDSNKYTFLINEALLGYDSLNFHIINNLYNVFINDIDLVAADYEAKMTFIVKPDVKIFGKDGSINKNIYDYSNITKLFSFAKKYNKKLKFGPIINYEDIPNNLKLEIANIDKEKRREYLLNFIDDYVCSLSLWALENHFNFRQIDAITDIASNNQKEGMIRRNFFSENLDINPNNGDIYYIDILKIVKKYFALSEIIISDYNEYDTSKSTRICGIVNDILEKSKRDNIKYIDGLGLKSHYSTWFIKNNEKCILNDIMIYKTMLDYKKLGISLYRTECDFKRFKYDNDYYKNIIEALEYSDNECFINGYILYGNSSKLTWYYCADSNSNLIDSLGRRTKDFNTVKDILIKNERRFNSNNNFDEYEFLNTLINYVYNLFVSSKIDLSDKNHKEVVDYIYCYYYNCFDSFIDVNINIKKKKIIEVISSDLKQCLLVGCSTIEQFRDFLILYSKIKNEVDCREKIEEFKKHLFRSTNNYKKRRKKKRSFSLNDILLFLFCLIFGGFSIFLIIKCILVIFE